MRIPMSSETPTAPSDAAASFGSWLEESRAWIEPLLDGLLPGASERPKRLHMAMRHALLAGGKRLRPALVRTVAHALGSGDQAALLPAAAVELVHTYSLVHDDLPCMDDDDLRRGRPTVHVAFDEATAVLAGDALLTMAFEVLAGAPQLQVASLVRVLARASGSIGMVGGQVLDLALEQRQSEARSTTSGPALTSVERLHTWKTAALFGAAAEMGAIVAGAGPAACLEVRAYGVALGRLFQAVDDVLDVVGDARTLGKTPGKDAAHERPTLVAVLGLDGARKHAEKLAEESRTRARTLGWAAGQPAWDVIEFTLSRRT